MKKSSHVGSRGPKVSFASEEAAARTAARRTAELGVVFQTYRCRWKAVEEHWHIYQVRPPRGWTATRVHEAWDREVGPRVVGCWNGENFGSDEARERHVRARAEAVERRRPA